jgi:hypothetical protein
MPIQLIQALIPVIVGLQHVLVGLGVRQFLLVLFLVLLYLHEIVRFGLDLTVDRVFRDLLVFVGLLLLNHGAVEVGGREVLDDVAFEFRRETTAEVIKKTQHLLSLLILIYTIIPRLVQMDF